MTSASDPRVRSFHVHANERPTAGVRSRWRLWLLTRLQRLLPAVDGFPFHISTEIATKINLIQLNSMKKKIK